MFISELFDVFKRKPKDYGKAHRGGLDLEYYIGDGPYQGKITINAKSAGDTILGQVTFDTQPDGALYPLDLWVDEDVRGQGIAALMYDWTKELGYKIRRSGEQTDAGKAFWDKNRGEEGQVWESELDEVTTVPTVAKSKRAHLDVMPNDGKPIPIGDEADYLGDKIGNLGKAEVWQYNQGPMRTFCVFDPQTRVSQLAVTGSSFPDNPDSLIIKGVYSGPANTTRAANLYAWLVAKHGLTLVSDIKQSEGGYRVWQELERKFGQYITVYGFNTKTDEPVNVTTKDEPDTHVDQEHLPGATRDTKDIAKNLRLVATPK
jgi:hypothetical protein